MLPAALYIFAGDWFLCQVFLGSRGVWAPGRAQKGVSEDAHFCGHWAEPLFQNGQHNYTAIKWNRAGLCISCTPTPPHPLSPNCVITWTLPTVENPKFLGFFATVPKELCWTFPCSDLCCVMVSRINVTDFEYLKYILILNIKQYKVIRHTGIDESTKFEEKLLSCP